MGMLWYNSQILIKWKSKDIIAEYALKKSKRKCCRDPSSVARRKIIENSIYVWKMSTVQAKHNCRCTPVTSARHILEYLQQI